MMALRALDNLRQIGVVRSSLAARVDAPLQGNEGAPDAWIEFDARYEAGLEGVVVDSRIVLVTWLHLADRETLRVRPRRDPSAAITGVFNTRSPDRPNPIGLHEVTVKERAGNRLRVGPLEALDGTPVIDVKPVLC